MLLDVYRSFVAEDAPTLAGGLTEDPTEADGPDPSANPPEEHRHDTHP
ncbi:hypothetical protein [Microlunatus sagamiharensis]|nr:hypothetical protein [Microlunatus sagamiharensis]